MSISGLLSNKKLMAGADPGLILGAAKFYKKSWT